MQFQLISTNLYQIYDYINNSKFVGEKAGMLLYPAVDKKLDLRYSIPGKKIYVKTLNLNESWEKIQDRLKEIAGVIYN